MGALSSTEQAASSARRPSRCWPRSRPGRRSTAAPRNLDGLKPMADLLADAFSALPGEVVLDEAAPVEAIDPDGKARESAHGRNLHLAVRPEAPVQLLLTGHMDTVFAADHPFQALNWIEAGKCSAGPASPT